MIRPLRVPAAGLWPALGVALFLISLPIVLRAAETNGPPETWLTNTVHYPSLPASNAIQSARFSQLQAVFLADTVRILWTPSAGDPAERSVLKLSVDEPGHWPARDWRSYPMERRGPNWETIVPVDTLDVPLVYYVEVIAGQGAHVSPMRLCRPRLLGLEQPTRVFWPFLEGFEEGLESWRWLAGGPEDGHLQTTGVVKNGKVALAIGIPPGKAAVTVGTTRLRGWQIAEHGVTGISVWLRIREGSGRARFTLLADAFTTNQVVAASQSEATIEPQWRQIELPFQSFGKFPLS
ncbi:MAG: hypothetical protein NTW03_03775, partial [Verrucomicrobia bacterium]|nr:hypothetical protein [Verrucomicrobiota bacterium]